MQVTGIALGAVLAITAAQPGSSAQIRLEHCVVSLDKDIQVPAQQAGVLEEMTVREGDAAGSDQLLAKIKDTLAQMQLKVAELRLEVATEEAENTTNLEYARAAAVLAKHEWDRAVNANKTRLGSVPAEEVERRRLTYQRSLWEIQQASVNLRIAGKQKSVAKQESEAAAESLDRHLIKSPINGVVQKLYREAGEWVQPGDAVLRIIQMDRLRVDGFVDAEEYSQAEIDGRPVTVRVRLPRRAEPEEFRGQIGFVSDEVLIGGERKVRAEVANRKQGEYWLLSPGMKAEMIIHLK